MFVQVNTFQAIKEYFEDGLSNVYSKNEIRILLEITTEHFLGWNSMEQKLKLDARLSESELLDFHFTLKRLKQKEPIQYILEEAPFMGLNLKVTRATLIPRPETEELVNKLIKELTSRNSVLDIGTGSGCIPIAIKKARPELNLYGIDISQDAINVAEENASNNQLDIKFGIHDILSQNMLPDGFPNKFDVIVSNPPYVRKMEKSDMHESVLEFEPHLALFVEDDDPLIFYKKIAEHGAKWLNQHGKLYFEINQYLANETAELIKELGYNNVEIINDINNNARILYAEK